MRIGYRFLLKLPDNPELEHVPVGLGIARWSWHQSNTTAEISRSLARL